MPDQDNRLVYQFVATLTEPSGREVRTNCEIDAEKLESGEASLEQQVSKYLKQMESLRKLADRLDQEIADETT